MSSAPAGRPPDLPVRRDQPPGPQNQLRRPDAGAGRGPAGTAAGRVVDRARADFLVCLGEGLSDAQIAARPYLLEATTIKGSVSRMLDKLGCANRTQAGLLAHDAGIIGQ